MKLFWLLLCLYALNGQAQEDLTINQLQFVGSHNSYKLKMNLVVFAALSVWDSKVAQSLDYSHIPINAEHVPIWISFNAKDQKIDGLPDPDVFSDQAFRVLDQLIEEAFDRQIIWSRDIGGLNWPRVIDSRGKFFLCLMKAVRSGSVTRIGGRNVLCLRRLNLRILLLQF